MNIGAYLREVLQENEEVIVQDLGTFQTSYASAEIHPTTHVFSPPNKNINFHTKTKTSNLILEHYISQKESVPIEEAKEQVRNFVSNLKMNLSIEKHIELESLGQLVLQVNNEIEFKQNKQTNILNDSFGLPEIYAKLVDSKDFAATKSQLSPQSSTRKIQPLPKEEEGKKAWSTIAAIGSLALVVVAVIYVVAIDSSLNPFNKLLSQKKEEVKKDVLLPSDNQITENNTQEPPQEQKNISENNTSQENTSNNTTNNTTNENTTENKTIAENNTPTSNQQETENKTITENQKNQEAKPKGDGILIEVRNNQFYVVIAGFGNQANAYKKVRETKKLGLDNVKIIPPFDAKNLYRVAVGGYNSRPEADSKLEEIKNVLGVDAWILKY